MRSRRMGDDTAGGSDITQQLHSRKSYPSPKLHAQSSADRASVQRVGGRWHLSGPILSRCAVDTWSKFNAQATGIPSSGVNTTSVWADRELFAWRARR